MDRYTPVPPIKKTPATKKKLIPTNIRTTATNSTNNRMPAEKEKFERLDDLFNLDGQDMESIISELGRRLNRLQKLSDFSTNVCTHILVPVTVNKNY
jgi:hypothetical protein